MFEDNKRYYTLNHYYKMKYNMRVFKVSLNGGFSCPNFDNNKKGCIFCSSKGSGDFAGDVKDDLLTQFNDIKTKLNNKWPDTKYIAYFQANTNTYAPVDVLKEKFEQVLKFPNVVGLNIGTRPDAISKDCLEYLIDLNKRCDLTIELGLQSMHDETLKLINRGHDLNCFDDCVKKLRNNNINVVVHIINGLPNEDKDMMINTVRHLNKLDIQGIKIHMLHVLKNTELENYYRKNKFHLLTEDEYIDIVCDQLEILNNDIVVHRLTGDGKKEDLIEPLWTLDKVNVLNHIDQELNKRNTYQGFRQDYINKIVQIKNKMFKDKDYVYLETIDKKIISLFDKNIVNINNKNISLAIIDNINNLDNIYKNLNNKGSILIIGNFNINNYKYIKYNFENNNLIEIRKDKQ